MKKITGFRLRSGRRHDGVQALPEAYQDAAALNRLLDKIRTMGETFFTMSEDIYGDWLDSLPKDEFIELIALK
ncbi:hypothetical protein [Janthinobacterium sp. CAN_S7]|uniref:hypothetical protein n=1 Tax=Janthinobacterium sp. CAN_S7 TaxID=3071704 RepID=UPI00319E9869